MSLEVFKQPHTEDVYFLTPAQEEEIVMQCSEIWHSGENILSGSRDRKKRVVRAYECCHEDFARSRTGSRAYLPWIYTAIESAHARLTAAILPNDEDIFALIGETPDDQSGCDVMSKYLKATFKDMSFQNIMSDAIKELLFGEVVIKLYWRKDSRVYTEKTRNEGDFVENIDGPNVKNTTMNVYNNVYAEIISSDDFIIFPVSGDVTRSTCAHRVWRYLDELIAVQEAGVYRNIDKICNDISQETRESLCSEKGRSDKQGLEVKEFWLHRIKVGGTIYRNMIATIIENKYLVRFEPNPYDFGLRPFIYSPLIQDFKIEGGLQNTGHGLGDRALEIQKMANFIVNQVFDESKIKLFGFYKYVDDGVFNPATFVSRPGGMIRVGQLDNLAPVNPNLGQLSFGITELQYLENQFEQVTGIPKFLKGMQDFLPGKDTATAKRLAAEGADTRFRALARRINENLLKPFIMMTYSMIRQHSIVDADVLYDIARKTQESRFTSIDPLTGKEFIEEYDMLTLIQKLPIIPPLPKVDVNIIGFENILDKADKALQLERFIVGLLQLAQYDPSILKFLKSDIALRAYARYLSVETELIRDNDELVSM